MENKLAKNNTRKRVESVWVESAAIGSLPYIFFYSSAQVTYTPR